MPKWLEAAARMSSIAETCEKMDPPLSITEYLKARADDPEFDAACLVFDQVIELRIIENIRLSSEKGDARAQALYFRDARRPSFTPGFASWHAAPTPPPPPASNPLSAEVAAAMIEAGLTKYEAQIRADAEKSKAPAPSKKPRRAAAAARKVRAEDDAKP
jgi:hypothetical protein